MPKQNFILPYLNFFWGGAKSGNWRRKFVEAQSRQRRGAEALRYWRFSKIFIK